MRIKITLFLIFGITWLGLTGIPSDTGQAVNNFLIPCLIIILAGKLGLLPKKKIFNFGAVKYILWLIKEIITASITVSKIAWQRRILLEQALVPIKVIQETELGTVIYANSITLTPGTVSLAVDKDNILVHGLDISFINDLQSGVMDRKIKKIIDN